MITDIVALERSVKAASAASEKAAQARGRLPAGSSRARVTTANARWARKAEEAERLRRELDVVLVTTEPTSYSLRMADAKLTAETTIDGIDYRVRAGRAEMRPTGERRFSKMRSSDVLALKLDSAAWTWLRAHGIRRPGTPMPDGERRTVAVKLRLQPDEAADLAARVAASGLDMNRFIARELRLGKEKGSVVSIC